MYRREVCAVVQGSVPDTTAILVAAGASRRMGFDKLSYRLPDGRTVLETSCAALAAHPAVRQVVLVAGANRPECEAGRFVSRAVITAALEAAARTGAAAPAVPVKDTIKVAQGGRVVSTPDRAMLYAVQTPQCFSREKYRQALACVTGEQARQVTDDCSLFELAGMPVELTAGDYGNL